MPMYSRESKSAVTTKTPQQACPASRTPDADLSACPVIGARAAIPISQDQNHLQQTLMIGLLVGAASSAALYNGTGDISFTVIAGVVMGLIAVGLCNKYLNKKKDTDLKAHSKPKKYPLKNDGYFGPGSITWETGTHPSLLFAGLIAASIQMLHPLVVQLVINNGKIFTDSDDRVKQTVLHGKTLSYGDTFMQDAAIEKFVKQHNLMKGIDEEGRSYLASRPDLLLWVHYSLIWAVLEGFEKLGPQLTPEQQDQYVQEHGEEFLRILHKMMELLDKSNTEEKEKAHLLGLIIAAVKESPNNRKELNAYMVYMEKEKLKSTEQAERYRNTIFKVKSAPYSPMAAIERLIHRTCIEIMTPRHRELFGFPTSTFSVLPIAKLLVKILESLLPKEKMIAKARKELEEEGPFGKEFLKIVVEPAAERPALR